MNNTDQHLINIMTDAAKKDINAGITPVFRKVAVVRIFRYYGEIWAVHRYYTHYPELIDPAEKYAVTHYETGRSLELTGDDSSPESVIRLARSLIYQTVQTLTLEGYKAILNKYDKIN